MTIYIAEDDLGLARGMKFTLEKEGYQAETFPSLRLLTETIQTELPDLLLLDWNLPDGDGLTLCRELKESFDFPILMITARDLEIDQVMCLEEGADDYIAKPFSLAVLKARITALLRRSSREREAEMTLSSGAFLLDLKKMKAYRGNAELDLSPTELKLLRYFLENKNQVLLKEQILTRIWDESGSFVEENTLSVNIRRLRKKLGEAPGSPSPIKTIHGMGYLWEEL